MNLLYSLIFSYNDGQFAILGKNIDMIRDKIALANAKFEETGKKSGFIKEFLFGSGNVGGAKTEDDVRNQLIIRKKDIEPLKQAGDFNDFTPDKAQETLKSLQYMDARVRAGADSWDAYYSGLSKGEKWQVEFIKNNDLSTASVDDLTEAQKGAYKAALEHDKGLDNLTIGAKAAKAGMTALTIAGNMLINLGISALISLTIKGITKLINAQTDAINAQKEALDKIEEARKNLSTAKETIDDIKDDYPELSKGVDNLGRNVSLTGEEYRRYNEMVNKIADMFPTMVQGYTDEGNAIIKTKGDVKALTDAYKEQKQAAQDAILVNAETVFKGYKASLDDGFFSTGKLSKLEAGKDYVKNGRVEGWYSVLVKDLGGSYSDRHIGKKMKKFLDSHKDALPAYIRTLESEIAAITAPLKPIMQVYLESSEGFQGLPKETQNNVQQVVNALSDEFYQKFKSPTEMNSWINTTLLDLFKGEDFSLSFSATMDMKTMFENNEISYEDFVERLNALKKLLEAMGIDKNGEISSAIDVLFNIQSSDGADMDAVVKAAKKKFTSKEQKKKVKTLTKDQLEVVVSSDFEVGNTWDETLSNINKLLSPTQKPFSLTDEQQEKLDAYNDAVSDLAQKEKEFAKNLRDHDRNDHLEKLKADLSEHKSMLDAYSNQISVIDAGMKLLDEKDYDNKAAFTGDKLKLLSEQGAAVRAEFERVMNIIPQTGDEAVELSNRLSELGNQLRENASSIREVAVAQEELKISSISSTGEDYVSKLTSAVDLLDKKLDALKNKKSTKYTSQVLGEDLLFPNLADFEDPIAKKRAENQQLIDLEVEQQEKLNKIISDAIKQQNADNAVKRAEERQKLIEDMEKTRREANQKIEKCAKEIEEKVGLTVDQIQAKLSGIEIPEPDATGFNTGMDKLVNKAKEARAEIEKVLDMSSSENRTGNQTGFLNPTVSSYKVTSKYGKRNGKMHEGIDLGTPEGTPVLATKDGTVIVAGEVSGYGNAVYIDHGDGYVTRYGHLSTILAKKYQKVKAGDEIALSGNTGRSTGAHLHYEVRYNDKAVDPTLYMTGYAAGTSYGNRIAKNIGIAGENNKSEILIDKSTGELKHVNSPTPIDLSRTDVIGESETAKIFKNRAFADGTIDFEALFTGGKSIDEVLETVKKDYQDAQSQLNAKYQQRLYEITNGSFTTEIDRNTAYNNLKEMMINGTDGIPGLGDLAVRNYKMLGEAYRIWNNLVQSGKIELLPESVTKWAEALKSASDAVEAADSKINAVYEQRVSDITETLQEFNTEFENTASVNSALDNWEDFTHSFAAKDEIAQYEIGIQKILGAIETMRKAELPDDLKVENLKNLGKQLQQEAIKLYDLLKKQRIKHYETLIAKEESLRDIKQQEFDLLNKMTQAEKEARVALRTSLIGSQYLDAETRKLVYNEDDYRKEMASIKRIRSEVKSISEEFYAKISKLNEDDIETKEQITNEYQRQLDLKEHELGIAEKEVTLQKKRDQLNNVLAERNVRQIINGKWAWVADTDKVRSATEELMDAEYEIENAKEQMSQQIMIQTYNRNIDNLNLMKSETEKGVGEFREHVTQLCQVVDDTCIPIANLGDALNEWLKNLNTTVDSNDRVYGREISRKASSSISYDKNTDYSALMANTKKGSAAWTLLNMKRNAKIDGENLPYKKYSYATGTKSAKRGWAELCESGDEVMITSNGVFKNLRGREMIFNNEQTKMLWDMTANGGKGLFTDFAAKLNIPNVAQRNEVVDKSTTFTGDINIQQVTDLNAFMRALLNEMRKPRG